MIDRFHREISYLRLSVTDLCNYRCTYCMAEDGVCKKSHTDILPLEELVRIARTACDLGVTKIRLTGGEPLVRRGIISLCEQIRAISPDLELCLTTNGSLLRKFAAPLKQAGVNRLNISLDTLDPALFRQITRVGELQDVLDGIDAAIAAGFENTKLNTVLMGGINDSEIPTLLDFAVSKGLTLRLIELMPMVVCRTWEKDRFVSADSVLQQFSVPSQTAEDGVARLYRIANNKGCIGVISPMSHRFCADCNRIRVTADGKLKPCLHSREEIDLRGLDDHALRDAILHGVMLKPQGHHLDTSTQTHRNMNEIGG